MNHRAPRCVSVAVLSLLVGTLACGGDGSEEAPNSGEPVEDPYGGEEPTTAVTLPFEDPTPMPTPIPAPLLSLIHI